MRVMPRSTVATSVSDPMQRAAPVFLTVVALVGSTAVASAERPTARAAETAAAQFCSGVDVAELQRPYVFQYGLSGGQLQTAFFARNGGLNGRGYRPRRLTGYRSGSTQLFATRWVRAPGPAWTARFGLTDSQFASLFQQLRGTHRPVDVSGYNAPGGAVRYAVIWERNTNPRVEWRIHRDVTRAEMEALVNEYGRSDWVPLRVEAYRASGQLRYISIWARTACDWRMHNRMTRSEYQSRFDGYASTHRLVHLDSFVEGNTPYFAAIWWRQPGPTQDVRSDRDWYAFQRISDNNACQGRVLGNLYAAEAPGGGVRYGGIWVSTGTPTFGASASLEARIRQETNCAPARAGAAVFNLTTGEQILVNADASYGTSSTIKSAILYALLRRIDTSADTLETFLPIRERYGTNQGGSLAPKRSYRLRFLATTMIQNSNNWATNRLIDYVGMAQVNSELGRLGVNGITLQRYMTGTGSPGARSGSSSPGGDYVRGFDNIATPRAYATFLQLMHQNAGGLSAASRTFFWDTLGLNGGAHDAVLDAGVATDRSFVTLAEKAGSNTWSSAPRAKPQIVGRHFQRSVAGRMVFSGGQVVVYAAFADEGTGANANPLQSMLDCVVMHAMRRYSGRTTGRAVAGCAAG